MNSYFAVIFEAKEGGFVAHFPDIPEAVTQGETLEECIDMAKDVLDEVLERYIFERREIPVSSSLDVIEEKAQEEIAENGDTLNLSFKPLFQYFKASDMEMKPVRVSVSFPKSTLEAIDKKAEQLGLTRSGLLAKGALAY